MEPGAIRAGERGIWGNEPLRGSIRGGRKCGGECSAALKSALILWSCAYLRQEAAGRVLQLVSGRTQWVDRLFSKILFRQEFSRALNDQCELTGVDMDVLLAHLAKDKRLIAYDGEVLSDNLCN